MVTDTSADLLSGTSSLKKNDRFKFFIVSQGEPLTLQSTLFPHHSTALSL